MLWNAISSRPWRNEFMWHKMPDHVKGLSDGGDEKAMRAALRQPALSGATVKCV